jgi:hypothetical protein
MPQDGDDEPDGRDDIRRLLASGKNVVSTAVTAWSTRAVSATK